MSESYALKSSRQMEMAECMSMHIMGGKLPTLVSASPINIQPFLMC